MKSIKKGFRPHYLFAISDIIIVFGLTMLSLLNHYGLSGINEHMTACLIYSASLAVFNVLVFLLARIYRMLTKDFVLFESVTIFSFSMGVQLT